MRKPLLVPAVLLFVAGCATAPVNMDEPRRVVGTENGVRIDAQILGDQLSPSVQIPITYDITNERPAPIAIADLIPEATYDEDTQTVTVSIGSEVPGVEYLPRLIAIAPGEKRTFKVVARVSLVINRGVTPMSRFPNALRLKVNFLSDTAPFEELITMTERAWQNPKLADELFPIWLEKNETVYTNALPMRWTFGPPAEPSPARRR